MARVRNLEIKILRLRLSQESQKSKKEVSQDGSLNVHRRGSK